MIDNFNKIFPFGRDNSINKHARASLLVVKHHKTQRIIVNITQNVVSCSGNHIMVPLPALDNNRVGQQLLRRVVPHATAGRQRHRLRGQVHRRILLVVVERRHLPDRDEKNLVRQTFTSGSNLRRRFLRSSSTALVRFASRF